MFITYYYLTNLILDIIYFLRYLLKFDYDMISGIKKIQSHISNLEIIIN
jgi:hypothetical protein